MTQLKTWVFASANNTDKLLSPLLTRFTIIHLKPYTREEFVEIAVNILNRDEGIDKDVAKFIAELVFDKLELTATETVSDFEIYLPNVGASPLICVGPI